MVDKKKCSLNNVEKKILEDIGTNQNLLQVRYNTFIEMLEGRLNLPPGSIGPVNSLTTHMITPEGDRVIKKEDPEESSTDPEESSIKE
jgi:hypothetical protein